MMEKLEAVLSSIEEDHMLIVCNDGSTDGTSDFLESYGKSLSLEVIEHKINRGLGETVRDLVEKAIELGSDGDSIIRMDCDDTHEPRYIPKLIQKLNEGFDVAIASRFATGGGQLGVSPYRNFVSRAANLFMRLFFPIKGLREYSCGYRGYDYSIIKKAINFYGNEFIQLKGLGFTCTLEKLVKLNLIGAKVAEVPFLHRYDQKRSKSKMVSSVTTLGYLVMVLLYHWPWGGWRSTFKNGRPTN